MSTSIIDIAATSEGYDVDVDVDADNSTKEGEQNNLYTIDKLKKTLNPLYLSLRCFGLAYDGIFETRHLRLNSVEPSGDETPGDIEAQNKNESTRQPKRKLNCNPGKCYCIFATVLLWYQVIVSLRSLITEDNILGLMSASVPFGWMLQCACQQLVFFLAISRQRENKLSKFGKFVKEMVLVKAGNLAETDRQVRVIVFVSWLVLLINVVTVFVAFFNPNTAREFREVTLGKWDQDVLVIITYIYLPIHVIFSGVWLFSTANYVALCMLVAKRFDDVFQRASDAISSKKNLSIASLRREHVQLCHVVSALDDILSPSGVVSYAIFIPLTCIVLNLCITTFNESSLIKIVAYIFWILSNVTILFISSVSGALVYHKAYSLSDVIYDINVNDLDSKSELELMLLISNLNSNSTSLTVGGLTAITKGMILSVFGAVVGYFIILIQFQG